MHCNNTVAISKVFTLEISTCKGPELTLHPLNKLQSIKRICLLLFTCLLEYRDLTDSKSMLVIQPAILCCYFKGFPGISS